MQNRITQEIAARLTFRELQNYLTWDTSRCLIIDLNLPGDSSHYRRCRIIYDHYQSWLKNGGVLCQSEFPPVPEPSETPCDCEIPEGQRWHKADRGEPVLWFASPGRDNIGQLSTLLAVIEHAHAQWMSVCGIKFAQARSERAADIVWRYGRLARNVAGRAWQPRNGDMMNPNNACPLCGDITMNTVGTWLYQQRLARAVHELGHGLGFGHVTDEPDDALYPNLHDKMHLIDYNSTSAKTARKAYGEPATAAA